MMIWIFIPFHTMVPFYHPFHPAILLLLNICLRSAKMKNSDNPKKWTFSWADKLGILTNYIKIDSSQNSINRTIAKVTKVRREFEIRNFEKEWLSETTVKTILKFFVKFLNFCLIFSKTLVLVSKDHFASFRYVVILSWFRAENSQKIRKIAENKNYWIIIIHDH